MDVVTGISGLVGSHVALELLVQGRPVRGIVRAGSDRSIIRAVFNHYRRDGNALFDRIEWTETDLLDVVGLREAFTCAERVFHCAALVSMDARDSRQLFAVNIGGTANVVNAALECGVQRLVHVSSIAATGRTPDGSAVNEDSPWVRDKHTSAYAISKYDAELEVQRGVAEGLSAVMVNPGVVYGPGQKGRSSLAVIDRVCKGTAFYPTGSNGIVDVRDVAQAMLELAEVGGDGERYILSTPPVPYKDLFGMIAKAAGRRAPDRALPLWTLEVAWRFEAVRTGLFGGRSLVTRNAVRSATSHYSYDTSKVRALGITFRPPEETILNAVAFARRSA
ncbi:MAG: NAD-dependent epimerase/dehydratase family protein [Flavobacteriales bacterium]|nr:MAG: NAD-dependent epimerase/dehydratase family protein [Flavobacteriales bacterium]